MVNSSQPLLFSSFLKDLLDQSILSDSLDAQFPNLIKVASPLPLIEELNLGREVNKVGEDWPSRILNGDLPSLKEFPQKPNHQDQEDAAGSANIKKDDDTSLPQRGINLAGELADKLADEAAPISLPLVMQTLQQQATPVLPLPNSPISLALAPRQASSISGRYFFDDNNDGLENSWEEGVRDTRVFLYDTINSRIVANVLTDDSGRYEFNNVQPLAQYSVLFDNPNRRTDLENYRFTTGNAGSNDAIDSDVLLTRLDGRGQTQNFSFRNGQALTDIDAGVRQQLPTSDFISGRYFFDDNNDSIENVGEEGVGGARVFLYDDVNFRIVDEVWTDQTGNYQFKDVQALGRYFIFFENPNDIPNVDNYHFTSFGIGSDNATNSDVFAALLDGRGRTKVFAFDRGQALTDVDAGLKRRINTEVRLV